MVKFLVTKRRNKDLSIQQYRDYQAQFSTAQQQDKPIFVPEEDVLNRHRFKRHKDLVTTFDPLTTLNDPVPPPFKTYTFDLMDKLQTMPRQLGRIRSMCLTLPLMLHNLSKVYEILFSNLELDTSWEFLVSVLRDTKQASFNLILQRLGKLVFGVADYFSQKYFSMIFEVVSVFYETNFKAIQDSVDHVWDVFQGSLFSYPNKYIRKFSASSFRYVLDRLSESNYNRFLSEMCQRELGEEEAEAISEALSSVLRSVNGFLTKQSIERLNRMWSLVSEDVLTKILERLVSRVSMKENKYDLVFDLVDIAVLVVAKCRDNLSCGCRFFVSVFSQHSLAKSSNKLKELLKQLTTQVLESDSVPVSFVELMAIGVSVNNRVSNQELGYLKALGIEEKKLFLDLVRLRTKEASGELLGVMVALLIDILKEFMSTGDNVEIVYTLIILLEKHDFKDKFIVEVTATDIENILQYSFQRAFVSIKLWKHIQIPHLLQSKLVETIRALDKRFEGVLVEYTTKSPLPLEAFIVYNYEFPTVYRIVAIKKELNSLLETHGLQDQHSSLSLFQLLFSNEQREGKYVDLRSRVRHSRLNSIHRHREEISDYLYETLTRIDSENVDIHNERDLKVTMMEMPEQLDKSDVPVVLNWLLGFAFTGFNEIEDAFIGLLGKLLERYPKECMEDLMRFLEFMNYKMSRRFIQTITNFIQQNPTELSEIPNQRFLELFTEDQPVEKNEAMEKVGFIRVTRTLQRHPKVKGKIASELTNLVDTYFQDEFWRDKNQMQQAKISGGVDVPMSQPGPHPHHLSVMLNLVPPSYIPPYECLHYSEDVCSIYEARGLKSQPWQNQWDKSKKVVESASTLLNLPKEEHRIYLHFLWGMIQASNQSDRDRIFEHLSQTNLEVEYLLNIHYHELFLDASTIEGMSAQELSHHLSFLQQSKILSFQHVSKSFIKCLSLQTIEFLPTLIKVILAIIRLGENHSLMTNANYKQINKESPKVLILVFETYSPSSFDNESLITQILDSLSDKINKLHQLAASGIPGILRLLEVWSRQPELHGVFTENIVLSLAEVYTSHVINEDSLQLINHTLINLLESEQVPVCLSSNSSVVLEKLYLYVENRYLTEDYVKMIGHLCEYATRVEGKVMDMFIKEISKSMKTKKKMAQSKDRRGHLLSVLLKMSHKTASKSESIKTLLYLLPELEEDQKQKASAVIGNTLVIDTSILSVVTKISAMRTKGLMVEPDFDLVFEGLGQLKSILPKVGLEEKEYIVFNVLGLGKNSELSLVNNFLGIISIFMNTLGHSEDDESLVKRITRTLLNILLNNSKTPDVFKVYVQAIGLVLLSIKKSPLNVGDMNSKVVDLANQDPEKDFFKLIVALSQSKRLKGLNYLRARLAEWTKGGDKSNFPNLVLDLLLVIIEHLISRKDSTGNLSSSLVLLSTQVYGQLYSFLEDSQIKQLLKRLMRGVKLQENTSQNLVLVKMISSILDHVEVGSNALSKVSKLIQEEGVDSLRKVKEDQEEQEMEEDIDDDEVVNLEKNYIKFDKKLIDTEANEKEDQDMSPLLTFLRKHVLVNLKSLLFLGLKTSTSSSKKDQQEKNRTFLTVVITKLLVKMGIKTFLIEFNKVVIKLCRLLKMRDDDSRDNARKSLVEVLKITGPQLIYVVIRELKQQLRQDFERHVLNYSIYYILEQLKLEGGVLDYSIPLIIPCAFEESIGVLSKEKEMVDANQIPIKLFEMKKKKGMLLFKLIGKVISVGKIDYLITTLKQEFKKHVVTEGNSDKFNEIIEHILSGFQKNQTLDTNQQIMIRLFSNVLELSAVELDNTSLTENTIQTWKRQAKGTNRQTYQLQDEAAEGKSIFKKLSNELNLKQNKKELEYMLYNFWLSLLHLCVKRVIITEEVLKSNPVLTSNINKFLVSCILSIDNRVVGKSLKVVESLIRWNNVISKEKIQSIILENFDKLTTGDETLARVNFTILTITYNEVKIPPHKLSKLFTFIELYLEDEVIEALHLFRLILEKEPTRSEVSRMMTPIREKMVSSHDMAIKKALKEIYLNYLTRVLSQQTNLLEEGINYILINTQYNDEGSRRILLDALQSIMHWLIIHNKTTFLYFSTITFYQLVVNYSNESEEDLKERISKIQLLICENVDRSRVKEFVSHCVCWIKENDEGLVYNGLTTLNTLSSKYLQMVTLELPSIMGVLEYILSTESSKVQLYYEEQREKKVREKKLAQSQEWGQILDSTPASFNVSYCLPICLELADKLKILECESIKDHIWVLGSHPVKEIHSRCLQLSIQIQVLLDDSMFQKWLRSNISTMVRLVSGQSVRYLVDLMESFAKRRQVNLVNLVLIDIRKTLHEYIKSIESSAREIRYLASLLQQITDREQLLEFITSNTQQTLFEIVCKFVNQKDKIASIDQQINEALEKAFERIKGLVTPASFYGILSEMKRKQRVVREEKKAQISEMAITHPEEYHSLKIKRNKSKTNSQRHP